MNQELRKKIIITLCFYDVFDYPLTSFEVHKFLSNLPSGSEDSGENKFSLCEVSKELGSTELKLLIDRKNGFYFMRDRKDLEEKINLRIERNKISDFKIKKARRAAKILRLVPFVRSVVLTSRLALGNASKGSDLDFLIILKKKKIWTGRFLVGAVLHIFGLRRHGQKIADRVCLNFFITTKSLEIPFRDLFFAHEYATMIPLFGWKKFKKFQRKNLWIKEFRENFSPDEIANLNMVSDNWLTKLIRKTGEVILKPKIVENFFRKIQKKRIEGKEILLKHGKKEDDLSPNKRIVEYNDERLVFWPQRGRELERFFERISQLS